MSKQQADKVQEAVDRVIELAAELEAAGEASVDEKALAQARAALHKWVDSVTGVVITHAFGRVTLIHQNGHQSTIASSDLCYAMSAKPEA